MTKRFFDPFNSHKNDAPIIEEQELIGRGTDNINSTQPTPTVSNSSLPDKTKSRFNFGKNRENKEYSNIVNSQKKAFDPFNAHKNDAPIEDDEKNDQQSNTETLKQETQEVQTNTSEQPKKFRFGNKSATTNTPIQNQQVKKGFDPLNAHKANEPAIESSEVVENQQVLNKKTYQEDSDDDFDPFENMNKKPSENKDNQQNEAAKNIEKKNNTENISGITMTEKEFFNSDEYKKSISKTNYNYEGTNYDQLELSGINIQSIIVEIKAEANNDNKSTNFIEEQKKQERQQEIDNAVAALSEEQKKQEIIAYWKALSEKVDLIQVKQVMNLLGAGSNEDKIRNKFKMPWGDNISLKGQKWYNHNASDGGTGAISFAQHVLIKELHYLKSFDSKFLYALDNDAKKLEEVKKSGYNVKKFPQIKKELRKIAIKWLANQFGEKIDDDDIKASLKDFQKEEKKGFTPPEPVPHHTNWIRDYLVNDRFIPEYLVDKYLNSGKIYAGVPDWMLDKNHHIGKHYPKEKVYCVFLSKYAAECRTTCQEGANGFDKGFSTGSDKAVSGFTVLQDPEKAENKVAFVEGAIDALSYHVLFPGTFVISTGGTDNMNLMIRVAIETLENGYTLCVALDNDDAGAKMTKIFAEELQNTLGEDKYKEYISKKMIVRQKAENAKDWNAMLTNKIKNNNTLSKPKM